MKHELGGVGAHTRAAVPLPHHFGVLCRTISPCTLYVGLRDYRHVVGEVRSQGCQACRGKDCPSSNANCGSVERHWKV